MKLSFVLLSTFILLIPGSCTKDNTPGPPPVITHAVFTDIITGQPFRNVLIDILNCRGTDVLGQCNLNDITSIAYTDSAGSVEFDGNKGDGFVCVVPGFFPLDRYGTAKIDYNGSVYSIKLVPEAFLSLALSPQTNYPDGYRISMHWVCTYPTTYDIIGGDPQFLPSIINATADTLIKTIAGDINNKIAWELLDETGHAVRIDTIQNFVVPRSDTARMVLQF